jgi:hypothetical protein
VIVTITRRTTRRAVEVRRWRHVVAFTTMGWAVWRTIELGWWSVIATVVRRPIEVRRRRHTVAFPTMRLVIVRWFAVVRRFAMVRGLAMMRRFTMVRWRGVTTDR